MRAAAARHRTSYERYLKRPLDIVMAGGLLLVLLPVMLAVAIGVRLTMGPGVFYPQDRVGRNGKVFRIVKFRSMRHDRRHTSEPWSGPDRRMLHKRDDDPRHTPFGRFIRRFSLDELPQLWNVLAGDMSMVGPRPELPHVAHSTGIFEHPRHLVRPGITGPWQISADRNTLIAENVHLDAEYVDHLTMRRDLALIVKTPLALVGNRGS
jgi:lipopolysaccharide/colanic/teichoic acid biosynthesis glycosyltransferase